MYLYNDFWPRIEIGMYGICIYTFPVRFLLPFDIYLKIILSIIYYNNNMLKHVYDANLPSN